MVVDLLEQNGKACLHRSTTFWRRVGQQPTASPLYFGPKLGVSLDKLTEPATSGPTAGAYRYFTIEDD